MNRYGYALLFNAGVHDARDLDEAAEILLRARAQGFTNVRCDVNTSLTTRRPMTADEQDQLIETALKGAGS